MPVRSDSRCLGLQGLRKSIRRQDLEIRRAGFRRRTESSPAECSAALGVLADNLLSFQQERAQLKEHEHSAHRSTFSRTAIAWLVTVVIALVVFRRPLGELVKVLDQRAHKFSLGTHGEVNCPSFLQ